MMISALVLSQLLLSNPAVAVGVYGHVEQTTADGRVRLARFDTIEEGATIITHDAASAQIRLASGSLLRLGANSELSLAQMQHDKPAAKRKESLRLVAGRIWAQVTNLFGDSKFEVETSTAVAGVRGTSLIVEVSGGSGRFVLLEGAIDLLREGADLRLDQPGSFVEATNDGFGKPGTLAAEAMRDLQRQIGGAGGAMVSTLTAQRTSGAKGGANRSASRSDITGPGQLVDSPAAAAPALSPPPIAVEPVPTTTNVNVVITLPASDAAPQ